MKTIKYAASALAVFVVIVFTAPLWGGCNFNSNLCHSWCELRHFNSGFNEATCKASCLTDKLSCMAK
ncbi:hypothetical protein [Oceanicoccus sagamiensis]|uniref:Uncharacterized protein n=1 Tax=Oceanicoccus sagamiensis TaxID=716816 RepID=A0A1X9NFA0_9GAMM|nr:hypothetical protein [Oceanicoccus sagamiensis]ARN76206.1 hypothetical protein BST96_20130 [Oceanicoccus sagamiensis]